MMPVLSRYILVVDDESSVRLSLARYLEDREWRVISAASAEEALSTLTSCTIDVAIVDIRLPGLDGNGFIMEAKKIQPPLKFLIYTGSSSYELPASLKELDIKREDIFRKPLQDLDIIVKALCRLVNM